MGKRVTVRLEDPASDAWDRYVTKHGVSKTGLAQALGEMIAEGNDRWIPAEAVARARAVDRERRRRK